MSKKIEIKVGEIAVGDKGMRISTLGIGSCMVVCLFDKQKKVGGLIHAMLPCRNGSVDNECTALTPTNPLLGDLKYTDEAIDILVDKIIKINGKKEDLVAKLVGGANMFKFFGDNKKSVGARNIDIARRKLESLGIVIENEDVGGSVGRMVEFNVSNGVLMVTSRL